MMRSLFIAIENYVILHLAVLDSVRLHLCVISLAGQTFMQESLTWETSVCDMTIQATTTQFSTHVWCLCSLKAQIIICGNELKWFLLFTRYLNRY